MTTLVKHKGFFMNNKLIFITVFISNIAFGAVVSLPTRIDTINTKENQTLAHKSVKKLSQQGLESDVALNQVTNTLKAHGNTSEIMVQNILAAVPTLHEEDIVAFVAQKALHKEHIDLSSYETLISLIQHKSRVLLDSKMTNTLQQICTRNQQIKKGTV